MFTQTTGLSRMTPDAYTVYHGLTVRVNWSPVVTSLLSVFVQVGDVNVDHMIVDDVTNNNTEPV
jgi:hypothetical protein